MFNSNSKGNQLNYKSFKQRTNEQQQQSDMNRFITKQNQNIFNINEDRSEQLSLSNNMEETSNFSYHNSQFKSKMQQSQNCVNYIAKSFKKLRIKTIEYYLNQILQPEQKSKKIDQFYINQFTAEQDAKFTIKMPLIKLSINISLTEEQQVAASFINYGYGFRVLKKIIEPFIPEPCYNSLIGNVIKLTFRKIEQRMRIFGHSIIPISLHDQQTLRVQLINCFRWLPLDELYTFFRYVKLTFNFEQIAINPRDTTKLYTSFMQKLKQKLINKADNNYNGQLQKMQAKIIHLQVYNPQINYPVYNPQIRYPLNNFLPYNPQVNYIPMLNHKSIVKNQSIKKCIKLQLQTKTVQNLSETDE